MEEEKLGKILVDGKLIDLDNASLDELYEIQGKILEQEAEIRKNIESILNDDETEKDELDEHVEFDELIQAEDEER